jgi:hypothetical protein
MTKPYCCGFFFETKIISLGSFQKVPNHGGD